MRIDPFIEESIQDYHNSGDLEALVLKVNLRFNLLRGLKKHGI